MSNITVTHFIPLIGPFVEASNRLGLNTVQIVSYQKMQGNEQHIYLNGNFKGEPILIPDDDLNEYNPSLDNMKRYIKENNIKSTDLVLGVPPCAGFSMLSSNTSADAKANLCMIEAIKFFVASESKVLCFENAPGFAGFKGLDFIERYVEPILPPEYKMTLVKTDTNQHGIPQNRPRTFMYIYKADVNKKILNIEEIHHKTLKEMFVGLGEAENENNLHVYLKGKDIDNWTEWANSPQGMSIVKDVIIEKLDKEDYRQDIIVETFRRIREVPGFAIQGNDYVERNMVNLKAKCDAKGAVTFRDSGPIIFRHRTSAIVGKNNTNLSRTFINVQGKWVDFFNDWLPEQDPSTVVDSIKKAEIKIRPMTMREKMRMMGWQDTYTIADYVRNNNHICQSVPVSTAVSAVKWALQILENASVEDVQIEPVSRLLFQVNTRSEMNKDVNFITETKILNINKINDKITQTAKLDDWDETDCCD